MSRLLFYNFFLSSQLSPAASSSPTFFCYYSFVYLYRNFASTTAISDATAVSPLRCLSQNETSLCAGGWVWGLEHIGREGYAVAMGANS